MTKAEKILEASQVALGRAGVVAESAMKAAMEDWLEALPKPAVKEFFGVRKKFPNPKDKKTVDAKNLEILKKYKVKPLINDPSHGFSLDALSCCLDMLVGGQGESAEKQGDSLTEGSGGVVRFELDGKPLMVLRVPDAKTAIKYWVERGALPVQAKAPGNYLIPFLFRGEPQQGNLYKKGQRRDAKQVTKSESAEKQGDSLTEGKGDYYAVEGTVDGQAGGAQTAPTTQEAMGYAEAMLAYLKKQSPKAKKITVHIFKVVNYQRKDTPMKVLKAESRETQGDTLAEGKAVKIGRLTFESFTNGSISGWWVKHITVVQGQGVWKPNTLGWIEERKSTKTSVIPSFLWLEKGNGEENTKALIVWPKGSAPVAGANIVVASNPGTGGLLQAVAKWIQERRPDLVKEETLEPKLTEAEKIIEASQVALGRAGVLSEEKQAPRITEKMIRDDMGLGSQDIGKGAMQILRSGWCANCDKEWYAVVFLAKNRTWWAEISGLDRHATYTNMGKRNLHNAALAKFDAPGKWKDTTGQKYTPVTN